MRLEPPSSPDAGTTDIAAAIRDAHRVIGQGPAITVLFPDGRQEQGMASLAQWSAKGAHLLEADLLLQPGDRLILDAPLSWTTAAVCLAAWWAGVTVTLHDPDGSTDTGDPTGTDDHSGDAPTVIHEDHLAATRPRGEVFTLGDAIDGSPVADGLPEPWVRAVQAFPDQPPTPRAQADLPALEAEGRLWTQAELLTAARAMPPGVCGVESGAIPAWQSVIAIAVRPLVHGRPTVALRGVPRDAATGDRVAHWL